jgi:hypothetical protein
MSILYCANCQEIAVSIYRVTKSSSIPFCSRHLPKFLNSPKYVGTVVKISDLPKTLSSTKTTTKKSATVVTEPVTVEETPAVEEVAPEVKEAE